MVYGAIDLHTRYSQIRIVDETGAVVREQRIVTSRERLVKTFTEFGSMRILLETGTESEWVAQALEEAGHEVIVADPNYAQRETKQILRARRLLVHTRTRGWRRGPPRMRLSRACGASPAWV